MLDSPQYESRILELDPDLISTPFEVQTNWHVITGTSCSGKSTLIDKLADRGFQTVPEVARQHFEKEIALGRTVSEIRENWFAVQQILMDMQRGIEYELHTNDVIFLDRALPDCLTFWRFLGQNPNEILSECFHHRYASVFILNPLPYKQDDVRSEDEATREYLNTWLFRDYTALGYDVMRVPVLSPEERLAFILERLTERGLT